MRLTLIAAAASLCALAGCQTTSTGSIDVSSVQKAATAVCSFLPTAETVAGLIKVNDTRFTTAAAIAEAICNAINPNTPAGVMTLLKATPATVDGVVIRGKHVE
jgi:hypothetical protein